MIADSLLELLKGIFPFNELPQEDLLNALKGKLGEISFQTGEELSAQESLPPSLYLITEGSARALGSSDETPISLELIKPGSIVGWFSLATGIPCEWARAASPVKALRIPTESFLKLLKDHPDWADSLRSKTTLSELFPLVRDLLKKRGLPVAAAKQIAIELLPQAAVMPSISDAQASSADSPNSDLPSSIFYFPSSNGRSIGVPSDLLNTLLETLHSSVSSLPVLASASDAQVSSFKPQVSSSDTQVSSFKFACPSVATQRLGSGFCLPLILRFQVSGFRFQLSLPGRCYASVTASLFPIPTFPPDFPSIILNVTLPLVSYLHQLSYILDR